MSEKLNLNERLHRKVFSPLFKCLQKLSHFQQNTFISGLGSRQVTASYQNLHLGSNMFRQDFSVYLYSLHGLVGEQGVWYMLTTGKWTPLYTMLAQQRGKRLQHNCSFIAYSLVCPELTKGKRETWTSIVIASLLPVPLRPAVPEQSSDLSRGRKKKVRKHNLP